MSVAAEAPASIRVCRCGCGEHLPPDANLSQRYVAESHKRGHGPEHKCFCGCGEMTTAKRFVLGHQRHRRPDRLPLEFVETKLAEPMTARCKSCKFVARGSAREVIAAFAEHRKRCTATVAA
jgi:hypothetical protein